jgi:hypothetical protein
MGAEKLTWRRGSARTRGPAGTSGGRRADQRDEEVNGIESDRGGVDAVAGVGWREGGRRRAGVESVSESAQKQTGPGRRRAALTHSTHEPLYSAEEARARAKVDLLQRPRGGASGQPDAAARPQGGQLMLRCRYARARTDLALPKYRKISPGYIQPIAARICKIKLGPFAAWTRRAARLTAADPPARNGGKHQGTDDE